MVMNMPSVRRGFTLIELLVVIAIIGVLSSVVLSSLNTARAKARDASRAQTISQIQTALELYYDSYNGYPSMLENECGGTEGYTSSDNNFMQSLVTAGFLPSYPVDPAGTNCNIQYINNGTDGYNIFVRWETKPASGCNLNASGGWSCIGINKNPDW
jgi:prepilin-type N-terminal cleavage/methylation domain-containing protein